MLFLLILFTVVAADVFENLMAETRFPFLESNLGVGVYHRLLEEMISIVDDTWFEETVTTTTSSSSISEDISDDTSEDLSDDLSDYLIPRKLLGLGIIEGPGRDLCRRSGIAAYERLCAAKCANKVSKNTVMPTSATTLPICVDTCRVTALEMCESQKCREFGCVVSIPVCRRMAGEFC